MSLVVVRSAVVVLISPGNLLIFPPIVIWAQCVSSSCVGISATILPWVTFVPAGMFSLRINKAVLVPDVILVTTPCASRTILFSNELYQMALVGP